MSGGSQTTQCADKKIDHGSNDNGICHSALIGACALLGWFYMSIGGTVDGAKELKFINRVSLDGLRALSPVSRADFAVGVLWKKRS